MPPRRRAPQPRRLGEFELLSELGRGGMGVVYRAWQPSLGRQVALKCLLRAGDPKAEARFAREIHALGRVEHPNLVKVFTSGSEGDQWFYAMELVEGATLAAVCGQLQGRGSGAAERGPGDLARHAEHRLPGGPRRRAAAERRRADGRPARPGRRPTPSAPRRRRRPRLRPARRRAGPPGGRGGPRAARGRRRPPRHQAGQHHGDARRRRRRC